MSVRYQREVVWLILLQINFKNLLPRPSGQISLYAHGYNYIKIIIHVCTTQNKSDTVGENQKMIGESHLE